MVEHALSSLVCKPIVVRLFGYVQHNDRMAVREITKQIREQVGREDILTIKAAANTSLKFSHSEGTPSKFWSMTQLSSFISTLSRFSRPLFIVLDAFDNFTLHPRQALLYCLFDAAQSGRCPSSRTSSNPVGFGVIGMTSKVDVINVLEKRVKSRFSHRSFHTAGVQHVGDWEALLERCLRSNLQHQCGISDSCEPSERKTE